ncbi:hypothetical protein Y1Q_0024709 [Alligator mississippiensis]|uniref:Uncharacterized protein n=1 Tax=Alligator mississippiensis TaxID=8496 RepID=A0A151PGU3_ALLMI|nr:hypothetical protein Y1Q_0024709 [Alligator mississippiensis]
MRTRKDTYTMLTDPVFCVEQNSSDNFPQRLIFFFSVCPQCKQVPCLEEGIHALNLEDPGVVSVFRERSG